MPDALIHEAAVSARSTGFLRAGSADRDGRRAIDPPGKTDVTIPPKRPGMDCIDEKNREAKVARSEDGRSLD